MADTIVDIFFTDDGRKGPFQEGKHPRTKTNGTFAPTPIDTHYEARHGLQPASYKSKARLAEIKAEHRRRKRKKSASAQEPK